jgi:cell division protein FtsQ
MATETGRLRDTGLLLLLMACALLLTVRVVYLFLADAQLFPIHTVKIVANYQHITRQQLERVLSSYLDASFYSFPVKRLQADLLALDWSDQVYIERTWPGTLKITVIEKKPIAIWNDVLMTDAGELFNVGKKQSETTLPRLNGPEDQHKDVLQMYQKLSKLLATYGLRAVSLQQRDNQAWELFLMNGVRLLLGQRDLDKRLLRFCKAYPVLFEEKFDQLMSVDLRYARGMAVQWKEPK